MISKFILWLARKQIADLRFRYERESAARALESWNNGFAIGQMAGQQLMVSELERIVSENKQVLATESDVAQLKKGMLH